MSRQAERVAVMRCLKGRHSQARSPEWSVIHLEADTAGMGEDFLHGLARSKQQGPSLCAPIVSHHPLLPLLCTGC